MSFIDEMWGQSRDWVIGHRERDLPRPRVTPGLAAKWLVDEWALQVEVAQSRLRWPASDYRRRLRDDYRGVRGEGAVPGHAYGLSLAPLQRAQLLVYLRTL